MLGSNHINVHQQPTDFWLNTFTIDEAFSRPELISSLSSFASVRYQTLNASEKEVLFSRRKRGDGPSLETSLLLLHVEAAASYYSPHESLMKSVPPVLADVILDPYLLNVFPRSLVPTAIYIVVIALVAIGLSRYISRFLSQLVGSRDTQKQKKSQ